MDGWMDGVLFNIAFDCIIIISGQLEDDDERLCSRFETFSPPAGLESRTAE